MNAILQKSTFLFFLLFFLSADIIAQQNRFIYIQTENKQAFYVKLDKKLLSSSASGYLIIPQLKDGTYDLSVGFPKNEWPEQNFTFTINKTDAGYVLKNFGEKGWGLFNLQTMQVLMPVKKATDNKAVIIENNADAFSMVLSQVVNDPGIRQKYIVKTDTVLSDQKRAWPVLSKGTIIRLMSNTVPGGMKMTYLDIVNGIIDTVTIFIPADKSMIKSETENRVEKSKAEEAKNHSKNSNAGLKIADDTAITAKKLQR